MAISRKFKIFSSLLIALLVAASFWHSQQIENLVSFNRERLIHKVQGRPPEWMSTQIQSDLAPFSLTGIDSASLLDFFLDPSHSDHCLALFTVKNGRLFARARENVARSQSFQEVKLALEILLQTLPVQNCSFLVNLTSPSTTISEPSAIPILAFAKKRGVSGPVLVPDSDALAGHLELKRLVREGAKKYPWRKKMARAFWRGSAKGDDLAALQWKGSPRARVTLLSSEYPELIDAKFYDLGGASEPAQKEILSQALKGPFVTVSEHFKYKYLVDIDGFSCTNKRCFGELYSNSVPLKQESDSIQWYHSHLKPYIHYIPLKRDLSDLTEKINWAVNHDGQAKQIAKNGTLFVEENLAYEDLLLYIYLLLDNYARLQNNNQ